ncbi:signal recognition particle-docking protein FtsY [Corticimicrobacter populi]|uniref:Signal recognition particle receptor FtsY n=1 Tax=Corticimicrobacter populi TaxID=2175229 RepID=A0A2V1K3C2_9BURK|nr:signal recognition particle-docking protein FtsY [Corticimicrobacter populi]PWF24057.1 signal recognition particle-docking protein FtsY [Corticimicrobacter populi]
MFSFLKRKKTAEPAGQPATEQAQVAETALPALQADTAASVPAAAEAQAIVAAPVSEEQVALPEAIQASEPSVSVPTPVETTAPVMLEPEVVPAAGPAAMPGFTSVPEPLPAVVPADATEAQPARKSWLARLRSGLSRTGQNISHLFVGVKVDENLFEELETALIMADAGMEATESMLQALRGRVRKERIEDAGQVKAALADILAAHLAPLQQRLDLGRARPLTVMIAGVNGAGKTTSIGKLAHDFQRQGASVLLAAGDTFRAAAREQLVAWGQRNNVAVIAQDGGDPAAVAFDAVNAGRARGMGVVMVDTAGRLPTQLHLMEELKKIRRVIAKADAEAPHEVLLVVDGNTGQNALAQIKAFDEALGLTGLVVTKLDGTAKGGILAAVAAGSQGVRPVPVYWIGVGEGMEDLQPFDAREFAQALLGD